MRIIYLVLVVAVGLLASSDAASLDSVNSNEAGVSLVSSGTVHRRLLRGVKTAGMDSIEEEDEDRAMTSAGGLIRDKAATKQWLYKLLYQGKSVHQVKGLLNMNKLSWDGMIEHINWSALVRYQRLKWEQENGKILPYAVFGLGGQTKKNTHKVLTGWANHHKSVEDVGKYLGVWGLPRSEQIVHQNWRAFKAYQKMFAQTQPLRDETRYAIYDGVYRGIAEMKETLTKWAMKGYPIDYIADVFGVKGLSGAKLEQHVNYRAFQTYEKYFDQLAPLRAGRVSS